MSLNHQNKILRTHGLLVGAVLLVLAIAPSVSADRIVGVTATTTMGSGFGTNLINTVNGNGLSPISLTALHAATNPGNSWVSSQGVLVGQITFNLGALYSVDSFSFWNQNAGGPGAAGSTGINRATVLTSTDGIVFTPLVGGPAGFARVITGVSPPEIFSFTAVSATHFRFLVLSNYGDVAQTGFAEVGFNAAGPGPGPIPEPATMLLLGTGLTGFAARALRRRKACK